ncbi:MAG: hypothetical protein Q4E41_06160 [Bacteroidales bacterium]|nr:hypothetical protein [Bacteroidales bacterium]
MKKLLLIFTIAMMAFVTAKAEEIEATVTVTDRGYVQIEAKGTFFGAINEVKEFTRSLQGETTDVLQYMKGTSDDPNNPAHWCNINVNSSLTQSSVTFTDVFYLPGATKENVVEMLRSMDLFYTYRYGHYLLNDNTGVYTLSLRSNVVTGVDDVDAAKEVAGVTYFNLNGQQAAEPFSGVNVKVTTYTDGSKQSVKMVK